MLGNCRNEYFSFIDLYFSYSHFSVLKLMILSKGLEHKNFFSSVFPLQEHFCFCLFVVVVPLPQPCELFEIRYQTLNRFLRQFCYCFLLLQQVDTNIGEKDSLLISSIV